MSNQSPSKSDVTDSSIMDDKNPTGAKQLLNFEWTTKLEKCLLYNMIRLKPCGKSDVALFAFVFHKGCTI